MKTLVNITNRSQKKRLPLLFWGIKDFGITTSEMVLITDLPHVRVNGVIILSLCVLLFMFILSLPSDPQSTKESYLEQETAGLEPIYNNT
jgi:hypothetical protein